MMNTIYDGIYDDAARAGVLPKPATPAMLLGLAEVLRKHNEAKKEVYTTLYNSYEA